MRLKTHQTIGKVSDDIGRRYTFNTAIAAVMELLNQATRFTCQSAQDRAVLKEALQTVVLLLSPIVPHVCHRLWQILGHDGPVVDARWPLADERALFQPKVQLVVQVNGKLRGRINVDAAAAREQCEALAVGDDNVKRHLDGKTVRKVIVVPGKLINIVAS